jgi:formate dehydrogenase subunit gamma
MTERTVHWIVAATFLYAMLTGLALFWPPFFWLAGLFGGGPVMRFWHPIGATVFVATVFLMLARWAKDLMLEPGDREWVSQLRAYTTGDDGVPESGRFNAGQKLLFYLQVTSGLLLLLSGIVMWFPHTFSVGVRQTSFVVHDLAAIAAIGALILHIYMGVFITRGSWEAMTRGTVSSRWAEAHHGRWFKALKATASHPRQ